MARPYPSNTERPKGGLQIKEIRSGKFHVFFTPPKVAIRNASDSPKDYKKRILEIDCENQTLTIFPYRVWDSMQPMVGRYYHLNKITINVVFPENSSFKEELDIEGLLEMELPRFSPGTFTMG